MRFLWHDKNSVMKRLCRIGLLSFKEDEEDRKVFQQLQNELKNSQKYSALSSVREAMKECR